MLKKNPNVLVLLAAYNGTDWLAEQVKSILCQVGVDVTIFISVDASDDATESLVDKLSIADQRIHVLTHGHKFGGAAPNFYRLMRDVNLNGYDFVALSDQDDVWLDQKLSSACELLHHDSADAYSSNVKAFWPSGKTLLINKSQNQVEWDFVFEAAGPGCTYVFKIELAKRLQDLVKGDLPRINMVGLHDWLFYAYARSHGFKWTIDKRAFIEYRQHSNNQVGVNLGIKAFRQRLSLILSGWWFEQAILISQIVGISAKPFFSRWAKLDKFGILCLALRAKSCRRRQRDKIIFFFLCLMFVFFGRKRR